MGFEPPCAPLRCSKGAFCVSREPLRHEPEAREPIRARSNTALMAGQFAGTPGIAGARGSTRYTWRGAAVRDALDDAVQTAMQQTAEEAKQEAQDAAPVDTGLLRSSVFAQVDARGGSGRRTLVLGADAPYAAYVILGTSRMPARDFIRPVVDRIAPKLTERLRAAIRGIR